MDKTIVKKAHSHNTVVITSTPPTPILPLASGDNNMINKSFHDDSCRRDSLNSLNDEFNDSVVFDSTQKLSIPKQNTLPVKGRFGGTTNLILEDDDDQHHPDGRIRRRWRNIERGIHKRVEDFRDHRLKQRRLYFHESDLIPNPHPQSSNFKQQQQKTTKSPPFKKSVSHDPRNLSAKDITLNFPKHNIPSNNFSISNNNLKNHNNFASSHTRVFQSSSSFNTTSTSRSITTSTSNNNNQNFTGTNSSSSTSPQSPQLFIKQIPRNAAYRDMLHALTSGFLPHVWIDVQVKKSRSYRRRFYKSKINNNKK